MDRVTQTQFRERNRARDIGINLSREIETNRHEEETDDVPVLRDNDAPVDSLLDPMAGQQYVIQETNRTTATAD